MSIRIQEQVLFEIAMSMGTSLNLDEMLSVSLSSYLRCTCCMAARVYLKEEQDGRIGYNQVYSIPRKTRRRGGAVFDSFLELINNWRAEQDYIDLSKALPVHRSVEGIHYYLMELPGTGFLMIAKGDSPLSNSLLKSLHKLNSKLSDFIVSCLIHQRNEVLNMQLREQISEREKAEENLLAERKKYRIILENSPLGIVYFNQDGSIIDCNDKLTEIMGASRDRMIGFNLALHSYEGMRMAIGKALTGESATYQGRYTSVTGGRNVYLRTRFNPVTPGSHRTEVIGTVEELDDPEKDQM